ncbi:MAG: hypothetical protein JWM80_6688 [Cyanobacteria bacterium RYN_339]|nr:hypothetical protein [Cyanobacteria bacterium RYN_339]
MFSSQGYAFVKVCHDQRVTGGSSTPRVPSTAPVAGPAPAADADTAFQDAGLAEPGLTADQQKQRFIDGQFRGVPGGHPGGTEKALAAQFDKFAGADGKLDTSEFLQLTQASAAQPALPGSMAEYRKMSETERCKLVEGLTDEQAHGLPVAVLEAMSQELAAHEHNWKHTGAVDRALDDAMTPEGLAKQDLSKLTMDEARLLEQDCFDRDLNNDPAATAALRAKLDGIQDPKVRAQLKGTLDRWEADQKANATPG